MRPKYGGDVDPAADEHPAPAMDLPVIVQAITRLNIGGPARHVLDLATGLRDRYEMRVATGTAPLIEGELATGTVGIDRVSMVRAVTPRHDAVALGQMRRLLRDCGATLVHSHMAKAGTIARLAAATVHPRPSTVHTFHGHVLSGYFGPRAQHAFTVIERALAPRTDVLVAVSDEIRDELLDLGIGRPSQFEVVQLGLQLAPYLTVAGHSGDLRRPLGLSDNVPLVAVLARLAPIKDHRTLLEAMSQVPGAHLAVLGDGEARKESEELARQFGIAERTHFLGWCSDVPRALADADVVALTSRNEGTPMSLIEAGAAGRPVVATDVGGVSRVVVDGRSGLLVPPGDVAAVAGALRRLLEDDDLRRRFGDEARNHVSDEFGLQPFLDRMAHIYDDVLHGGMASSRRRGSRPRR